MSNTGSRAGSSDALSSLLTDLPGVEGNIFSRPKTLGGMKKVQQTPVKAQTSMSMSSKPLSDAPFPTSSRPPPSYPSPTKQEYESTPSKAHSIADLENMLHGSMPNTAAATSQIISQGQQQPSDAAASSFDDPFADFVSSPPTLSQPTAAGSTPLASSQIGLDEDPLGMFGGTPAPSKTLHNSHIKMNISNSPKQNDDFFADFSEAPSASPAAAPAAAQQTSSHSIPSPSMHDYAEVDLAEENHSNRDAAPSQAPSLAAPLRTASVSSTSSSVKDRISGHPASTKASHKAFQFLDAKEAVGAAAAAVQPGRNSHRPDSDGARFDDYQQHSQSPSSSHGGHGGSINPTTESVVELGQRAAKALQAGTKWFMKASKHIATEVHSKLEKHRQHHTDSPVTGMTTSHSFYFDWASQIARMSPGTRAAAMGAMQEDDRLEVQKIIDEAELGEVMLSSTINNSMDHSGGPLGQGRRKVSDWSSADDGYGDINTPSFERQQQQQQRRGVAPQPPLPPPSYDELMGSSEAKADEEDSIPPVGSARVVVEHEEDLLGMSGKRSPSAAAALEVPEDDLLGMDADNRNDTNLSPKEGTGHIDDLFTVPKPKAPPAMVKPHRGTAATEPKQRSGGLSSMIDLGDSLPDVDTTGYSELYGENESGAGGVIGIGGEDPNEPEIRKILREKRIAEKHGRMKQQLAEKRAREEAEDAEKAGKVAFRDTLKPKIDAWSSNKKDNIRALLSTVHTVLWEDSGWTAPSIADMVDPGKVKKWYMKANLVVHPDKVKQKGGTLEQVATADMVFDVLKGAWGKFEASR
ncbi:hypothetical protein Ndes2526B_g08874 [Nannochloris sp. 'desiccata']